MPDDAKSVAERAMQGWKAVNEKASSTSFVDAKKPSVDSVGVSLDQLKSKYLGETSGWLGSDGGAARAPTEPIAGENSTLVVMERTDTTDTAPSRKTVLVYGKTVIGTQG